MSKEEKEIGKGKLFALLSEVSNTVSFVGDLQKKSGEDEPFHKSRFRQLAVNANAKVLLPAAAELATNPTADDLALLSTLSNAVSHKWEKGQSLNATLQRYFRFKARNLENNEELLNLIEANSN